LLVRLCQKKKKLEAKSLIIDTQNGVIRYTIRRGLLTHSKSLIIDRTVLTGSELARGFLICTSEW
jgi:hypothetical protein